MTPAELQNKMEKKVPKLECLVALCRVLLHPQLIGKKKFGVKIYLSTQDGTKQPEMHEKVKVGVLQRTDRKRDRHTWQSDESLLAPARHD